MSKNKGYAWEHEIEEVMLEVGGQSASDPLFMRSHRQPASGAMDSAKGDVVTMFPWLNDFGQFMFECKDRKDGKGDGKSVRILKSELDKARVEAQAERMHTAFAFKVKQPVGGDRTPIFKGDKRNPMNTKWVALPLGTFVLVLEYIRDLVKEVNELRQVEESPSAAPSSYATSDKDCRRCRRELDRATESVRRTMGG